MVWGLLLGAFGSQEAASSWQIGSVLLPIGPKSLRVAGGINKEAMPQSEDEPVQVVDGLAGTTLTLGGTIADESKTDAQLWTDVISPLLELRGQEVILVCPIAGLCGTYLLDVFEPGRNKYQPIYEYTLRLSKSSLNVIFEADT